MIFIPLYIENVNPLHLQCPSSPIWPPVHPLSVAYTYTLQSVLNYFIRWVQFEHKLSINFFFEGNSMWTRYTNISIN
jgi:hypothetical protein